VKSKPRPPKTNSMLKPRAEAVRKTDSVLKKATMGGARLASHHEDVQSQRATEIMHRSYNLAADAMKSLTASEAQEAL
jgi:hypothetical protein